MTTPSFLFSYSQVKAVGRYKMKPRHPADADFQQLALYFEQNGFFKTNWNFYYKKLLVCVLLFMCTLTCVLGFTSMWIHFLGAVLLAYTWQQVGFIIHDTMHTQITRTPSKDHSIGVYFGTVIFGMSATWWRDEHRVHHALTNTVDAQKRWADPQMWEDSWAQHEKLFPLFRGYWQYFLIKIQHITFIPAVMLCGRFVILVESYAPERNPRELISIILHWIWMSWLLSHLPSWSEVAIFYLIASAIEGMFHFQLILSHYCKMFMDVEEFHGSSWYKQQVMSNMNISCPWWMDWYYGGLNYHIEHHLYPTLARDKLSAAVPYVKNICKRHGIQYDQEPFIVCFKKTLAHLKQTGSHYKLDVN